MKQVSYTRGIKNKHLKAGVVKNKNIYSWCLAFFCRKFKKKYYLVVQPAFLAQSFIKLSNSNLN